MAIDVRKFVDDIKSKTGINFSVFDEGGQFLYGACLPMGNLPKDTDRIVQDKQSGYTYFTIKLNGIKYILAVLGANEEQKNYAMLVTTLAESNFVKDAELTKNEFIRALVLGEVGYSQAIRYLKKFSIKDESAFVMIVTVEPKALADIKSILREYMNERAGFVVTIDESQLAIVKFIDEESLAYRSNTEYAEFLVRSVYEESGEKISISIGGTVRTATSLNLSYNQAVSASRMGADDGQVHSFKEYVLIKMLEDMPKFKLNEYMEILADGNAKEIFDDEEMTGTAEEFLANSLNVSETSRKLYLHRNTLAYRLDKIERATGLNIRKFSDAVTFRLITVLLKLTR